MKLSVKLSGNIRIYVQPEIYQFNTCFEEYSFSVQLIKTGQDINIEIMSLEATNFYVYNLLFNELRKFEMLFVGGFYQTEEMLFCTEDKSEKILLENELSFFNLKPTNHSYELLCPFNNNSYCTYFERWLVLSKELGIIHQIFLYSISSTQMPADILMALLSQTYQPLYEYLVMKKRLLLFSKKSYYTCKKCGNKKEINCEPTFNECLTTIINKYGQNIFHSEWGNIASLIDKIVKTRNKIDHVDVTAENVWSGIQIAVCKLKLTLMYRYIILDLLGIDSQKNVTSIAKHIDATFPQGLCL